MKRIHYAWVICGLGTLTMACNMGLACNTLSFYLPFIEANGISAADGSALLSIRCMFSLLSMFLVNRYYRKLGYRVGLCAATAVAAAAYLTFFLSNSVLLYDLGAAIAGIAYGFGTMIPVSLLINRWFTLRRGLALGICAAGSGISGICFTPVIERLISAFGLRTAFLLEAVFLLFCALLMLLFLRDSPAEMNIFPYSKGVPALETANKNCSEWTLSKSGWAMLTFIMICTGGVALAGSGHQGVLLTSCGYSARTAALCISFFGLLLMLGKFLFGTAADRFGTRNASVAFSLTLVLGCFSSLLFDGKKLFACYLLAALTGLGYPPATVGMSLWAADFSSPARYADTLKWFQILNSAGGAVFSALPGIIFEHTGEYVSSFLLFGSLTAFSTVLLIICYRVRRPAALI